MNRTNEHGKVVSQARPWLSDDERSTLSSLIVTMLVVGFVLVVLGPWLTEWSVCRKVITNGLTCAVTGVLVWMDRYVYDHDFR